MIRVEYSWLDFFSQQLYLIQVLFYFDMTHVFFDNLNSQSVDNWSIDSSLKIELLNI